MYIKMNDDKSLLITIPTTIYRGENNADLITFLIPAKYQNKNLADCSIAMRYITPSNIGRSETLAMEPEMYKDYLQLSTVVNTRISKEAGTVTLWLTVIDPSDYVLFKSGELDIQVEENKDISEYLPPEDMDQLDRIGAEVEVLKANKADGIYYDFEDNVLHLTSNGTRIGEVVDMDHVAEDLEDILDDDDPSSNALIYF